jgi:DNA-binding transcriptional MerR regulator
MADITPIYNLKAVVNEVGLSATTLRAWELRYGLPKPQRTAGGHRLYSRQDIEMLKWLMERQKKGLSISQAIELWKVRELGEENISTRIQASITDVGMGEGMLDQLREKWTEACTVFDDQAANRVLDQAFAIGSPESICTEVLQKGLAHIGEGWYDGSISVQQEHFASAIAVRRLNSLLTAVSPPTRSGRILLACPPGESHDFILLLITYLLRRRSWDVIYLGSNVPLQDLDAAIEFTKPALVLSAAQTLTSAASLRTISEFLSTRDIPLAYGGGVFTLIPSVIKCISGYYLGSNVPMVPNSIELLIKAAPSMPIAQPLSPAYTQSLSLFHHNEAFIVGYVASTMQSIPVVPAHLEIANENLTQMIYSALILGDINLLDHSVSWLNGLLGNYGISTQLVEQFYAIYRQAVKHYLGVDGGLIEDWLSNQISD